MLRLIPRKSPGSQEGSPSLVVLLRTAELRIGFESALLVDFLKVVKDWSIFVKERDEEIYVKTLVTMIRRDMGVRSHDCHCHYRYRHRVFERPYRRPTRVQIQKMCRRCHSTCVGILRERMTTKGYGAVRGMSKGEQ